MKKTYKISLMHLVIAMLVGVLLVLALLLFQNMKVGGEALYGSAYHPAESTGELMTEKDTIRFDLESLLQGRQAPEQPTRLDFDTFIPLPEFGGNKDATQSLPTSTIEWIQIPYKYDEVNNRMIYLMIPRSGVRPELLYNEGVTGTRLEDIRR